jgi:hypothetical protein
MQATAHARPARTGPIRIGPRSTKHNSPLARAAMRGRQRAKIQEFRDALAAAVTLDTQAAVLTLPRGTKSLENDLAGSPVPPIDHWSREHFH